MNRRRRFRETSVTVLACLLPALGQGQALAADQAGLFQNRPAQDWIVSIGGTVQLGPAYDGANLARPGFQPSIAWRRADEPAGFTAPDDGLDLALVSNRRFSFGPVGSFRPGRYHSDDRDLAGLRTIPWTVEGGVFGEFWPWQDVLRLRAELRRGFHGHHGVVLDLSADLVQSLGAYRFSLGPRMELADTAFMRTNFGVSEQEALANGRVTPFRARGGVKSIGALASVLS